MGCMVKYNYVHDLRLENLYVQNFVNAVVWELEEK